MPTEIQVVHNEGGVPYVGGGTLAARPNPGVPGRLYVSEEPALYRDTGGSWVNVGASEAAASILSKILTVDGVGSGLDADLLDGLNSTDFAANNDARLSNDRIPTDGSVTALKMSAANKGVVICTSTTRPASPVEGQHIYETDTNATLKNTGTPAAPAWTAVGADAGGAVAADARITPSMYGAVPGEADSTVAVQAMMNEVRTSYSATLGAFTRYADLEGRMWRVSSIDATGVRQPGMRIQNGGLYGFSAGQNVLDLAGTNRAFIENFKFYGDKATPPAIGLLMSRAKDAAGSFPPAAHHNLTNVTSDGYFSKTSVLNFAAEVVNGGGCEFINRHRSISAFSVVIAGDANSIDQNVERVSSAYQIIPIPADGLQSNIVHNMGQLNAVRLADVNLPITGISKANPAVVSLDPTALANSNLVNGNQVFFADVAGMTQLNKNIYTVANINTVAGTFELSGTDSTAFGTFASGSVQNRTGPAVLLNGCTGVKMDSSYLLSYGSPSVVLDTRWGMVPSQIDLTYKGEHQPIDMLSFLVPETGTAVVRDLRLNLLSVSSRRSVLSKTGAGMMRIEGLKLDITDMPSPPLTGIFLPRSGFQVINARMHIPLAEHFTPTIAAGMNLFSGTVFAADTNTTDRYGTVTQR